MPGEVEIKEELQEAEEEDELTSALEGESKDSDDEGEGEGEKGEKEETGEAGEAEEKVGEKKEGEGEAEEPDVVKVLQEEVKDLRQMVRTSKRELTITQAKLERLGERPIRKEASDEDDEDDEDEGKKKGKEKEESLSTVEELQGAIAHVGATKGAVLDVLLETMEQNSKYQDIREVCSRGNFDDIFEVIAAEATKDGGNLDETLLEVELNVWNKSNPYKYMYDLIKKYHPTYAKKEDAAEPGDKKKEEGKDKTPVKAPGTIADKGGDSNLKSGWTAKRIDALPEDELHTVPKEVYDKYMKDELD
jgi:hypothetical protein